MTRTIRHMPSPTPDHVELPVKPFWHDSADVNLDMILRIVQEHLPPLVAQLEEIPKDIPPPPDAT
jgi:hypothetical protein